MASSDAYVDVGSYFVEVKATTQGDAKLTPKQAEVASLKGDRYVLCVADLRGVPEARLDQPWTPEDVLPLTRLIPGVAFWALDTWRLVEEARSNQVGLRNEGALRYAVPVKVWQGVHSIAEWVAAAFRTGA